MTDSVDEPSAPLAGVPTQVALLGLPHVRTADGRRLSLERRDAALLAWLAVHGDTPRTRLIELLWPDGDAEVSRNTLRQRLFQLKKRCGTDVVRGAEIVALGDGVTVDLRGDVTASNATLLDGCQYADCAAFSEWLAGQRDRLAQVRREALTAQAETAEREGRLAEALQLAEALIALDPLQEHSFRRLMRLHYLRGDRAAALAAFDRCEQLLKDELSAAPGAETLALLATIDRSGALPGPPRRAPIPASILRPPRMIGRERELERLRETCDAGRAALVLGEPGMGKTRLLTDFVPTGAHYVAVLARPGDAAVPYAVLARLLRGLVERAPPAPASRALFAHLVPELGGDAGGGAPIERATLIRALQDHLVTSARAGVAGLVVDDLHFADGASVEVLTAVGPDAVAAGLRLVMASRPAELTAAAETMRAGLSESGDLAEIVLSPLTEAQLAELVDSLSLQGVVGADIAPVLARHTGGNPLFALETLKALLVDRNGQAIRAGRLPLPSNVGALIETRLRKLSAPALALARTAAIAGQDFDTEMAQHVMQVRALELVDPWQELERAQVLLGVQFAHDLVYEAVLRQIPAPLAQHLHAAVAAFLEQRHGVAGRIAEHWRLAAHPLQAVPWWKEAARQALHSFDRPTAAHMLEHAAAALAEAGDRAEAFTVLAGCVELMQDFEVSARHDAGTLRLIELAATAEQRAHAWCLRAQRLLQIGSNAEGLAVAEQGAREAALCADRTAEARLLNVRGIALRRLDRPREAQPVLERSIDLCRQLELRDDLAAALNNLALVFMELDEQAQAIPRFEEAAGLQRDLPTRARVLNNLALSLEETGRAERAHSSREQALSLLIGQEGTTAASYNLLVSLSSSARRLMCYDAAIDYLRRAEVLSGDFRHWRRDQLLIERALTYIDLGAWSAADDLLRELEDVIDSSSGMYASRLLARATYLVRRGIDAERVVADVAGLAERANERRLHRRVLELRARTLAPEPRLELAREQLAIEKARGNAAAQIPFAVLAASALLDLGRGTEALVYSRQAVNAMENSLPTSMGPFEVRFVHLRARHATGDESARADAVALAGELRDLARTRVPLEYQSAFLQANVVHRDLVRVAREGFALPRPSSPRSTRRLG